MWPRDLRNISWEWGESGETHAGFFQFLSSKYWYPPKKVKKHGSNYLKFWSAYSHWIDSIPGALVNPYPPTRGDPFRDMLGELEGFCVSIKKLEFQGLTLVNLINSLFDYIYLSGIFQNEATEKKNLKIVEALVDFLWRKIVTCWNRIKKITLPLGLTQLTWMWLSQGGHQVLPSWVYRFIPCRKQQKAIKWKTSILLVGSQQIQHNYQVCLEIYF